MAFPLVTLIGFAVGAVVVLAVIVALVLLISKRQ